VRFWDTTALVPLLLDQVSTPEVRVLPSGEVRDQALRLLRVHSLRAADAVQLAAARVWAGSTAGAELVTYDEGLALAARLEGFRVLPSSPSF
jgi:predicted nucleic acid-binding protein